MAVMTNIITKPKDYNRLRHKQLDTRFCLMVHKVRFMAGRKEKWEYPEWLAQCQTLPDLSTKTRRRVSVAMKRSLVRPSPTVVIQTSRFGTSSHSHPRLGQAEQSSSSPFSYRSDYTSEVSCVTENSATTGCDVALTTARRLTAV